MLFNNRLNAVLPHQFYTVYALLYPSEVELVLLRVLHHLGNALPVGYAVGCAYGIHVVGTRGLQLEKLAPDARVYLVVAALVVAQPHLHAPLDVGGGEEYDAALVLRSEERR